MIRLRHTLEVYTMKIRLSKYFIPDATVSPPVPGKTQQRKIDRKYTYKFSLTARKNSAMITDGSARSDTY
jgi:hypothetical protein